MYLPLFSPGWLPGIAILLVLVVAVALRRLGRTSSMNHSAEKSRPTRKSRLEPARAYGKPLPRPDLYQGLLDDPDW